MRAVSVTDGSGVGSVFFNGGYSPSQVDVADAHGLGATASGSMGVGMPPVYALTLSADQNPLFPGQGTTLRAQLLDADTNAPVEGGAVNFSVSSGDGTLGGATAVTDASGQCAVWYAGGVSETQITASDAYGYGAPSGYSFGVATPGAGLTTWAGRDTLLPGESTVVYAMWWDGGTNAPVSGATVNFSVVSGDGTLASESATTDGSGMCAVGFVGGSSGTQIQSVAEEENSGTASSACTIGVAADTSGGGGGGGGDGGGGGGGEGGGGDPPPPSYVLFAFANQGVVVPGESTMARVYLAESHTNTPVVGATVNYEIIFGDGTLGATSAVTDSMGLCGVPYTGGSSPTQFTAWDDEDLGTSGSYTIGVGSPRGTLTLLADQNQLVSGQSTTVRANLRDAASGLPAGGITVKFHVISGTGTLASQSALTDGAGDCAVTFTGGSVGSHVHAWTPADYTASATRFIAKLSAGGGGSSGGGGGGGGGSGGGGGGGGGTGGEGGGGGSSLVYQVAAWGDSTTLYPGQVTTLHARVIQTADGMRVPDAILEFSVLYGDGTLDVVSATIDENGEYAVPFTGGATPTRVTVTSTNYEATPQSGTFLVEGWSADTYSIVMWADMILLQAGEQTTLHAELTDTSTGTRVPGVPLHFQVAYGNGTLDATSAITDSNGSCTLTYTEGSTSFAHTRIEAWDGHELGAFGEFIFGVVDTGGGDEGGGGGGVAVGCGCPQSGGRCQCPTTNDPATCACEPPPAAGCPCKATNFACNCGQPGVSANMICSPPPADPNAPYQPECMLQSNPPPPCECRGPGCDPGTCNCGGDHPENCQANDQNQGWVINSGVKHKAKTDPNPLRKKLGLSEEVNFSISDGSSATWKEIWSTGTTKDLGTGNTLVWMASPTATAAGQTIDIEAEVAGLRKSVRKFTVVAPEDIVATGRITYPQNNTGKIHTDTDSHCLALLEIEIKPIEVNFYNVAFSEQFAAADEGGDWAAVPWHPALDHAATVPKKIPGAQQNTDVDQLSSGYFGKEASWTWPNGSYTWKIKMDYQAEGGQLVQAWKTFDQVHTWSRVGATECKIEITKYGSPAVTNY